MESRRNGPQLSSRHDDDDDDDSLLSRKFAAVCQKIVTSCPPPVPYLLTHDPAETLIAVAANLLCVSM